MKKLIFFSFIIVAIISCSKVKITTPNFDVNTAKTTYTTAETVVFNFSGDPDYITFYSGEVHKNYTYANITQRTADSNIVTFSTVTTAPSTTATTATQPVSVNNVSILASTDFSGTMDSASIKKATWTDISGKAKFAATATTVSSGNINVSSLKSGSSPIYIAFKYVSATSASNYLSRKWTVNAFGFKNFFKDTTYVLATTFSNGGFYTKSILNSTNSWVFANASLTFNAPAVGSLPDEDWAISRAFDPSSVMPDLGVSIKTASDPLSQYSYKFTKAGTYTVTFVAKNQDSETSKQVAKQITLTITQ